MLDAKVLTSIRKLYINVAAIICMYFKYSSISYPPTNILVVMEYHINKIIVNYLRK